MATIKVTSTFGVDFDDYDLPDPAGGTVKTQTASKWHIDYPGGASDDYAGKSFTYNGNDLSPASAGTVTGFTIVESKGEQVAATGISVPAADLANAGTPTAFLSEALRGDDKITGGNGADHLLGFAGNDTIDGGKGADAMEGGDGNDIYILDNAGDTITEGVGGLSGVDTAKIGIASIQTGFANVENYTFTGKGNWNFTGNTLDNAITGGPGSDTLDGGGGNDTLDGGKGIDTFIGGAGDDTFIIDNVAELARITDSSGTDTLVGNVLLAKIANVENYSYTGKAAWTLSFDGDATAHKLSGGGGADTLTGGTKDDTLSGNAGNDVLDGKGGGDTMVGGLGNDMYIVDSTSDRITELAKGGTDVVKSSLAIDLLSGAAYAGQEIENATLTGAGNVDATGNTLKNVLTGNDGDNVLSGGGGNDTLIGGAGNDMLHGDAGKDAMSGGTGNDTYFIDDAGDKVTELVGQGDHDLVSSSILLKAAIKNVEDYTYTGGAAWTFTGNDLDNEVTGAAGQNHLIGGKGNDTLHGGAADDVLDGGLGNDAMIGGGGNDTYLVDSAGDKVTEAAGIGGGIDTVKASFAILDATNFANVENFIFTGKGNWAFTGNNAGDAITGGAGNDHLTGGTGNDVMDGGKGIDVLAGGQGNDVYMIDNAKDTVVEAAGQGFDTVKTALAALNAGTYDNVESFVFTGKGAWTFTGSGTDNQVQGGAGNDHLDGGAGNDTAVFSGKTSDYQVTYAADGSVIVKDLNDATNGADGTDTLTRFEHLEFSDGTTEIGATTVLKGAAAGDAAGGSVAAVGDINGDGHADFIVGAYNADASGKDSGAAYVVFGTGSDLPASLDLSSLNGSTGFKLSGGTAFGYAAVSTSGGGDINGDGIADLIVGAPGIDGRTGATYVVFGHTGGFAPDIDFTALTGSDGFRIDAGHNSYSGESVASIGDINGDGYDDVLVGAPLGNGYAGAYGGNAYVVFGHTGAFASAIDVSTLDGTNGFTMQGARTTLTGFSVASAGDFNGDGIDDLLVSSPGQNYGTGNVAVVLGHTGSFSATGSLSTFAHFSVSGEQFLNYTGWSAASAGDVNGDGLSDIVIGATGADIHGKDSGAAYVVFGAESFIGNEVGLNALDGTNGFKLYGIDSKDYAGWSVSSAGDINGDGYADLMVGAKGAGAQLQGDAYVLFGHANGFGASIDLAHLAADQGFVVAGAAGDQAGFSVSKAGDINGDGYDDLLVGSPFADPHGSGSGSVTVIYGGHFGETTLPLIEGTTGNDTKSGTGAAEIINGAQGNDTLNGGGGADVIHGGDGNDAIHVADHNFAHIDGGAGNDTLSLDYAGAIDFGDFDGNAATHDSGKIAGIEVIDADNGQNNAMTLDIADILNLMPQNQDAGGKASLDHVLRIDGNAGDTLHLALIEDWNVVAPDTTTLPGYAVYTSHTLKVAVDTDIAVHLS